MVSRRLRDFNNGLVRLAGGAAAGPVECGKFSLTPLFMADATPASPPRHLILALTRILRPVVRPLIHHQVTYPYVTQLLKGVDLEVALRVPQLLRPPLPRLQQPFDEYWIDAQ